MNDAKLLEQLSLTDAYGPDTDMPSAAWTRDTAFTAIERLIDVQTPEGPPASLPRRERRTGPLVAATAFVVVLVVGLALIGSLGSRPDDEPATTLPPVTTTTEATTTTAAPDVDTAALAFIESIVRDINSGDGQTAANLILSAVTFDGPFFEEPDENNQRPFMAGTVRYWAELDSEITVEECRTPSSGVTRCELSRVSEHEAYFPEPEGSVWRVRLEGDTVAFLSYAPGLSLIDEGGYLEWLQDVSPETVTAISVAADPIAAAEAQKRYVAQWRARN